MDGDDGLGILPTKEELEKKAEAKPSPAAAAPTSEPKAKKGKKSKALADMPEPVPVTGTQMLVLKTQVGQERRVAGEVRGGTSRCLGEAARAPDGQPGAGQAEHQRGQHHPAPGPPPGALRAGACERRSRPSHEEVTLAPRVAAMAATRAAAPEQP